ncbi:MAG: gliding motility-associated C-terminal domain-containing protein [Bacteroidetes bacterium]|nr:gliding motility-associated C-terminal domain-containing protein [Bacteroidota bacterium]
MTEKNIEQLFKDSLENLEAEVNPQVWKNISQSIQVPGAATQFAGSSAAVKSAALIGMKGWILISSLSLALVGTAVYFGFQKQNDAAITTTVPVPSPVLPLPENKNETPDAVNSSVPVTGSADAGTENRKKAIVQDKVDLPDGKNSLQNVPDNTASVPSKYSDGNGLPASGQPNQSNPIPSPQPVLSSPGKTQAISPGQNNAPDEMTSDSQTPQFDAIEHYIVTDDVDKPVLPNVFTPNGDGVNDKLVLKTVNLKSMEVIVYDRKGKKIYSWNSLNGEWDGRLTDGSEAKEGSYFYTLKAETMEGKICIAQSSLQLYR